MRSELSDFAKRPETSHCDDVSLRSDAASSKIRDLRQQVLKLQKKGSEHVKEVVMKDRLITELQTAITLLNNEKDELKNENNANLSVIQRLKDNLNDTRSRLSALEEDQDCSNYTGKMSSTASLPEIPGNHLHHSSSSLLLSPGLNQYSSKFARSLTRASQNSSLVQQLSDQLDIARSEKRQLEQQLTQLVTQLEIANTEKLTLENQLVLVRTELQELMREHDNLKDDFRTLVRKCDGEKQERGSPDSCVSKTKMLHDAQKGQLLQETEEKLEAAITQLQLRENEMENIAHHFDNVNQEIVQRNLELDNLRQEVLRLQTNLSESFAENQDLHNTLDQQKMTIQSLQTAVEDKRRSETRHKTVRLIYKESSDISDDEMEKHKYTNNNPPRSFLMSSSDSFEI